MKKVYYNIVLNDDESGVLCAPQQWKYPVACDAHEVSEWQSLVLELKDGPYCSYGLCNGARMICKELKDLILFYCGNEDCIKFFPVKVLSRKYGDREFYILHFTKIYDVIDKDHTVYFGDTDVILKERLDYDKVKDLHIFNSLPFANDTIISKELRDAIKKSGLAIGMDFSPIYCGG